MSQANVDAKLSVNTFRVDKTRPHIVLVENPDPAEAKKLVLVCPAGLYQLKDDGTLLFDYAGCLECGACKIVCGKSVIKRWQYPQGTLGVEYLYG